MAARPVVKPLPRHDLPRHQRPWHLPYQRRLSGPATAVPQRQANRDRQATAVRPRSPVPALIVCFGLALLGLVGLQVEILRINSRLGSTLERKAALQRAVLALQAENSALASPTRVLAQASRLGMVPVPEGAVRYLPLARGGGVGGP